MKKRLFQFPAFLIILILILGIAYLLLLQQLIPDGVFLSGDGGLKALIAQNLASGDMAFDLDLHAPSWIANLWAEGMFPYQEPFVYELADKYFITFPFSFPLVTAPFYSFFGFRGLYILPLLSTIVIWLVFYWLGWKLGLRPVLIAVGEFFLIFTTYLTIYSAIYWEHTLSVGLAFAGIALLVPKKGSEKLTTWAAVGAGILTGLSVWFRDEQLLLVLFLMMIALWAFVQAALKRQPGKWINSSNLPGYIGKTGWIYIATSLFVLLLYGFSNWLVYGNFMGVHTTQVLETQHLSDRIITAYHNLKLMTIGDKSFFLYLPIVFFPVVYAIFRILRRDYKKIHLDFFLWYGFCLAFIVGVSIVVPAGAGGQQWGPRFLLLLVPVIVLLVTWQMDRILQSIGDLQKPILLLGGILVLTLSVYGAYQNSVRGRTYLSDVYSRNQPAIEYLRQETEPVIAVSHQYLAQLFQPAISREVNFLRLSSEEDLSKFGKALVDEQIEGFTYICYTADWASPEGRCDFFTPSDKIIQINQDGAAYSLELLSVREFGRIAIQQVAVQKDN